MVAEEPANGLDELADRDRLGHIGLAAALADALLVALHGERGDGDDGNGPQIRIVLEPFGDFEAGHFGQLDVHQDQIGPMLAREVERLDAVARPHGVVAVRFQQIVEELHVELVVLDDQDGFGHPPIPHQPRRASAARVPRSAAKQTSPICYGKANNRMKAPLQPARRRRKSWRFRRFASLPASPSGLAAFSP